MLIRNIGLCEIVIGFMKEISPKTTQIFVPPFQYKDGAKCFVFFIARYYLKLCKPLSLRILLSLFLLKMLLGRKTKTYRPHIVFQTIVIFIHKKVATSAKLLKLELSLIKAKRKPLLL